MERSWSAPRRPRRPYGGTRMASSKSTDIRSPEAKSGARNSRYQIVVTPGPLSNLKVASMLARPDLPTIKSAVKAAADYLTQRDLPLSQEISKHFPDIRAVNSLLGQTSRLLPNLGVNVINQPVDEKKALIDGTLSELATWISAKAHPAPVAAA